MTTSSVDGAVGDERDDVVDTVEVVIIVGGVDDVEVVGGTVASNNGDVELVGGVSDRSIAYYTSSSTLFLNWRRVCRSPCRRQWCICD